MCKPCMWQNDWGRPGAAGGGLGRPWGPRCPGAALAAVRAGGTRHDEVTTARAKLIEKTSENE